MKKKAMTILYEVHSGLYVNLTNRCSCACTFCVRQSDDAVGKSDTLWLEHEPSFEEVMEAFSAFNMEASSLRGDASLGYTHSSKYKRPRIPYQQARYYS